jgi:hypothetical protein
MQYNNVIGKRLMYASFALVNSNNIHARSSRFLLPKQNARMNIELSPKPAEFI